MLKRINKPILAWSFYDWGNSAFACTVVAAFFPIFFKKYWASNIDPTESTLYLGTGMSIAALVFAVAAPILGNFADIYGLQKKGLVTFASMGSLACLLFYFIPQNAWAPALSVYAIGWLGFTGANLFYDSLLVSIAKEEDFNFVSCLGYGLGYLGGGLLIVINAMMVTKPEMFGLANAAEGVKWAFISVGVWWTLFTLPLIVWVKEAPPTKPKAHWLQGVTEVLETVKKIKNEKYLVLFLLSYFFYIDGVHTIYKMAVDFALSINLQSSDLIKAIVIVQFVGFPATIAFSFLAQKIGTRSGIFLGIFIYSVMCVAGAFISTATHFYILAIVLGLVQGGVQALSRSFYGQLIPQDHAAEYYGFYNMFGKFSAVLGPFLVGATSFLTGSPRLSLVAILILFVIGGLLLKQVPSSIKKASS